MSESRILAGCIATILAVAAGGGALAQQGGVAAGETRGLAEEMAQMNRSLDRLVMLMEEAIYQQRIDTVLRRIDVTQRGLIPLSTDLRELQARYDDRKAELKRLQEMMEMQEEQVSADVLRGIDQPGSESRSMLREMEHVFEMETARMEDLERRIRFLEDELDEGQRRLKNLNAQLDEMLE